MNKFMKEAFNQAKKAYLNNEVPIGAIIVKDDKIISKGYNKREKTQNAILHAEIDAIIKACNKLKSWRLDNCKIYVTVEPCPMCAGAIANARIEEVYFSCHETTSNDNLCEKILSSIRLNHKVKLIKIDDYENDIKVLLQNFFKEKRNTKTN